MNAVQFVRHCLKIGALLPLGLSACTTTAAENTVSSGPTVSASPSVAAPIEPLVVESPYRDYLIAQFAYRQNNIQDTIRYLQDVRRDAQDLGRQNDLMTRQLFSMLATEGKVQDALSVAPELSSPSLIAHLLETVSALKAQDDQAALSAAQMMSERGIGAFVRPLIVMDDRRDRRARQGPHDFSAFQRSERAANAVSPACRFALSS